MKIQELMDMLGVPPAIRALTLPAIPFLQRKDFGIRIDRGNETINLYIDGDLAGFKKFEELEKITCDADTDRQADSGPGGDNPCLAGIPGPGDCDQN